MAELLAQLASLPARVLRICPRQLNHTLPHLDPLLRKIEHLRPVLLVASDDLLSPQDLSITAARFPQLSFVLTSAAWSDLPNALDLLARHANLFLDTSWIHTCGTIEDIVHRFGPERLVFGLGHRTNGGASMAALIHAQIEPAAKLAIAQGNLCRLLDIPENRSAIAPGGPNRFWPYLMAHGHCDTEILDAHGHLGPVGTWMLPTQQIEPQIADYLPRMDRLRIRTMLVSGTHALFGDPVEGNRILARTAGAHPERFRGYLVFNPHYHKELTLLLGDFFGGDFFVGFKLLSSYWEVPVTDPRYIPVWEHAHRHRLPILLHTWADDFDLPMMLDGIASKYPDAQFVLGHSGGTNPGRASALELASRHSNVYLEWCGSYRMTSPYEELIETLGPSRFLFGTDATLHSPTWELGRFLSLDLPDAMLQPALGDNLRRILSLRR